MSVAASRRAAAALPCNQVLHGDNLPLLRKLPSESVQLIYIDPPFNTGKKQSRRRIKTIADANGDRTGFGNKRYKSETISISGYCDTFDDYIAFLTPRLQEAHRVLTASGSLFFHIDWRESARCRLLLEDIFGGGRHCMNEIIWAYDYGARSTKKWPAKHDNIYWFAKDPDNYIFNYDALERIPYMAPALAGDSKSSRGKTPTDVWWHTIVATNSKEKNGYPTQKPVDLIRWIIAAHSNAGDMVLDFFAGSGTCGVAAKALGRKFLLMDLAKEAVDIAANRSIDNHSAEQPGDKEEQILSAISGLKKTYRPDRSGWLGSPAAWMKELPSATKGAAGKKLAIQYLQMFGIDAQKKGRGLSYCNKRLDVKFSMLWETGEYGFEQIKPGADYFCFLGVSPYTVHLWIVPADEYDKFDSQHHSGSRWVSVNPDSPEQNNIRWSEYGGKLSTLTADTFNFLK